MFPLIKSIEQCRQAIVGRPEFSETDKGDYIVFNYHVAHTDSFDCPIRRELRGLTFSKDGQILSRPFHKFFNLNEKEETRNVDWTRPHSVLNKLDGSMIRPLSLPEGIRWATKAGVTDISMMCENYIKTFPRYEDFANMCIQSNCTPIFEYIAPNNRIVINYQYEELILLAIRNNLSGKYYSYETQLFLANQFDIPSVKPYLGKLDELLDQKDIEGVVVRFNDGQMIKIKTEWYVAIHKAKDNILHEKNVIKLILEERLDDIIQELPDYDRKKLEEYEDTLISNIEKAVEMCKAALKESEDQDKKHFAIHVAPKINPLLRVACFVNWNDPSKLRDSLIMNILKKTNTQTDVDSIRDIIGGKW